MKFKRLKAAGVGLAVFGSTVAVGQTIGDVVEAWPGNCQTMQSGNTAAAGICESGVSSDRHAICVRVWKPDLGGRYYNARGPWKQLGYTSPINVPSNHKIVSRWNGKNYSC
jgi:hypothetical protein